MDLRRGWPLPGDLQWQLAVKTATAAMVRHVLPAPRPRALRPRVPAAPATVRAERRRVKVEAFWPRQEPMLWKGKAWGRHVCGVQLGRGTVAWEGILLYLKLV